MPKRPDPDYPSHYAEPPSTQPALTTLAITLSTMRLKFGKGDLDGAVAIARVAAPHPRVPAAAPAFDFAGLPDAELDALDLRE